MFMAACNSELSLLQFIVHSQRISRISFLKMLYFLPQPGQLVLNPLSCNGIKFFSATRKVGEIPMETVFQSVGMGEAEKRALHSRDIAGHIRNRMNVPDPKKFIVRPTNQHCSIR